MTEAHNKLARSMISNVPDLAALRLEALAPEDVAAYLTWLNTEEAGAVLTHMMPGIAARVTTHMRAADAGAVLSAMPVHNAAAILRGLTPGQREDYLAAMARDRGRLAQMLADYPGNTAAAWMRHDIAILADDLTAGHARRQLADGPDSDIVYITSRDHDLRGHLAPARLLRLDDDAPIAEHLEEEPYYIAAGTRLSALIDHAGWQTRHVLPVVDPHQQVIGALYHNALYRGLKARSGEEQATPVTPIQDVGRLYAGTLLALFETASGLIRGEDRTGE